MSEHFYRTFSALGQILLVGFLQLQSKMPGAELNLSDCNGFNGTNCIVKTGLFKSCSIYNFSGEKKKM